MYSDYDPIGQLENDIKRSRERQKRKERYCPNCEQTVHPERAYNPVVMILGDLIIGIPIFLLTGFIGLIFLLIFNRLIIMLSPKRCPICKSKSLKSKEPK